MPKRKLTKTYSSSDSDSDNECLIQLLKAKSSCEGAQSFNINPQNRLCKPSQESCEFCDRTFSNRLEALVHNANHIIIPLLRNSSFNDHGKDSGIDNSKSNSSQTVPSSNRLVVSSQHFNNKIILGNKNKPKPAGITNRIVFEEDNDDVISISDSDNEVNTDAPNTQTELTKNEVLSNFVADCKVVLSDSMVLFNNSKDLEQKSEIPNGNKNKLLNSFTADCRVALGKPMSLEIETKTTQDGKQKILTLKRNNSTEKKTQQIDNRTHSKEAKILKKKESIEKITHQFENMCLPIDKNKNKGNKIEPRNTVQAADLFSHQNGIKIAFSCQREAMIKQVEDVKITENGIKAVPTQIKESNDNFEAKTLSHHGVSIPAPIIQNIDETVHKSVHYDDLQKPGLYKCDLCKYTFPNRFCIATHKTGHAKVKILKLNDEVKKNSINYCKPCQTYYTKTKAFLHHFSQRHSKNSIDSKPNQTSTNNIEYRAPPRSLLVSKSFLNNNTSFIDKLNRYNGESLYVCTINPTCLQLVKFNNFTKLGIFRKEIKICFFCGKEVSESAMVSRSGSYVNKLKYKPHNPPSHNMVASSPIGQSFCIPGGKIPPIRKSCMSQGGAVFAGPPAPPLPTPIRKDVPQLSLPVPFNVSLNSEIIHQSNAIVMRRIVPDESEEECVLGF